MTVIPPNQLKRTLATGGTAVGTMVVELRQPAVMSLLVHAGFDFVIIDNEHGPFNIETIAELSRVARAIGLTPIIRVPDLTYPHIAQSLDVGAQGIMVPRIVDHFQVQQAVAMMKFPPLGRRGNAGSRGYTDFRSGPTAEVLATSNEETLLIVQIETRQAVDNLEAIAAVDGVDVLLVGPNDLAISLGIPGQFNHPQLNQAIERVIEVCQQHQICPAIHINDLALASQWAKRGMRLLSTASETGLLVKAGRQVTETLKQAWQ